MSWLDRILGRDSSSNTGKSKVPEGVWTKCTSCDQVLYSEELKRNMQVCPKCDHHMRINARTRLLNLLDEGSAQEIAAELEPQDVLTFICRTKRDRRKRLVYRVSRYVTRNASGNSFF